MQKKIRNKQDRVLGEVRMISGNLIRELRDEGFTLLEPDWPKYLLIDAFGVPTFTHLKRSGERLSGRQMRTMNVLEKLGFNTLLVYQKQPKKLPEEMFTIGRKQRIGVKDKIEVFDPFEVFDSAKVRESIKEEKKESKMEDEKDYDDIMSILNIASRKKDTSPPLISTLEAPPEEAPSLERKVRVVGDEGEPSPLLSGKKDKV